MAVAEVIVICIDDSRWMPPDSAKFQMQLDAIKFYCKTKFQAHPDTVVGLFTMGSMRPRHLLHPPTGSLTQILDCLSEIYPGDGQLNLVHALTFARLPLLPFRGLPDKQTRILFFVGGLTNLTSRFAEKFGKGFRDQGVAVDVVNFYLGKTPRHAAAEYQYGRSELDAFVNICNHNDNSHIVDVEPRSDICEVLSNSICLSEKENDNVKGELELSGKNEAAAQMLEARGIEND